MRTKGKEDGQDATFIVKVPLHVLHLRFSGLNKEKGCRKMGKGRESDQTVRDSLCSAEPPPESNVFY